ncbi:hypothetical protein E5343_07195 [Rodentibacter caecimuris]|uniref:hypothetical protein n=1 Tax=Rodentibacter caecimuris TaxID=1796644 RepID=UPI001094E35D|nr:hypothetical protein [Pasteurella caecimuris]MCR1837815.1 hypothetical protein [Pasteurella caecimuris]MCU0108175.1 hypothetical protein [Pasteurella caecimuris]TGY49371.1 hypothetical protein E5343_07195 [Pasteurella caecimuris]
MGKTELLIQNLIIFIYVSLFAVFTFSINENFVYLLWLVVGDDVGVFIYPPLLVFFYQCYLKYKDKVYNISFFCLIVNMIIMSIFSYFIFFIIFGSFFYKGEGVQ